MITFVSDRIEQFKIARERARRKRIAILALCGFGFLAVFAGSIIAGIALARGRETRSVGRAKRREALREKAQHLLDFDDNSPATAYYDSEKGEFIKKEEKA